MTGSKRVLVASVAAAALLAAGLGMMSAACADAAGAFPYAISWETAPIGVVKLKDLPELCYKKEKGTAPADVEIMMEYTMANPGDKKPAARTTIACPGIALKEKEGVFERGAWFDRLKESLEENSRKLHISQAHVTVAVFKKRSGKDVPTQKVSNVIEIDVSLW